MTRAVILGAVALAALACERREPPLPPPEDAALERVEAGPYDVDGVSFTLVTHVVRYGAEQSVHALQLVDPTGRVHHEASFEQPEVAHYGLEFTLAITAWPVRAAGGEGLLLSYEYLPSAPLTGEAVQGFAVRNGTLQPLWPPLDWYGELQLPAADAAGVRRLERSDAVLLRAWRYHYGLIVPLALDWSCVPATPPCIDVLPPRRDAAADVALFDVWTDQRAPGTDGTVTLHAAPGSEERETVPVRTTSQIEVLEGAASVLLVRDERLSIDVRDEFLRVRIDGREGWIRGPEDFEAIGLPGAG